MADIYIPIYSAATVHFAQPDALKVNTPHCQSLVLEDDALLKIESRFIVSEIMKGGRVKVDGFGVNLFLPSRICPKKSQPFSFVLVVFQLSCVQRNLEMASK